jgi:predicted HTH transcriptional regulator
VLKTIAPFLNTEGGDLLIGVTDDGEIVGIEKDQLDSDDKFMRHLGQVVRNGLGDRAGTCIDPKTQIVQGKTVCVVSCQRSPEPVLLSWKGLETAAGGDFFVRSGPGTMKLPPGSAQEYIRTRFRRIVRERNPDGPLDGAVQSRRIETTAAVVPILIGSRGVTVEPAAVAEATPTTFMISFRYG